MSSSLWDRRLGFMNKVLSTPIARSSIVFSKVLSSVIRSLIQSTIVLLAALVLGLHTGPGFDLAAVIGVFGALFLLSLGLSSLFVAVAVRTGSMEVQVTVMNPVNLPLLFASNALFPTELMSTWLQIVARVNPVIYATDAMRRLLLHARSMPNLASDFLLLGFFSIMLACVGVFTSWRYLGK